MFSILFIILNNSEFRWFHEIRRIQNWRKTSISSVEIDSISFLIFSDVICNCEKTCENDTGGDVLEPGPPLLPLAGDTRYVRLHIQGYMFCKLRKNQLSSHEIMGPLDVWGIGNGWWLPQNCQITLHWGRETGGRMISKKISRGFKKMVYTGYISLI